MDESPIPPRPARSHAWWLPLLVPAIVLVLLTIDEVNRGVHTVHPRAVGAITGSVLIAALVGLPAFLAGVLYQRRTPR